MVVPGEAGCSSLHGVRKLEGTVGRLLAWRLNYSIGILQPLIGYRRSSILCFCVKAAKTRSL